MDRNEWLKEMRRDAEERYSTLWAPFYPEKFGKYANATHQQFIRRLLGLLPPHAALLDAACGAGRYFSMLLEKGHSVVGIDQSQGMLDRAKALFPDVRVEKVGLQEMTFRDTFDAAICVDALEHVPPEDWPIAFGNFHQALHAGGTLYFTVEIADEAQVKEAFLRAQKAGLPVVYGEWPDEDPYHFYPPIQQVRDWLEPAGFEIIEEGAGDGYAHFLGRKKASA